MAFVHCEQAALKTQTLDQALATMIDNHRSVWLWHFVAKDLFKRIFIAHASTLIRSSLGPVHGGDRGHHSNGSIEERGSTLIHPSRRGPSHGSYVCYCRPHFTRLDGSSCTDSKPHSNLRQLQCSGVDMLDPSKSVVNNPYIYVC